MQISFSGNDGNTTVVVECFENSDSNGGYKLDHVSNFNVYATLILGNGVINFFYCLRYGTNSLAAQTLYLLSFGWIQIIIGRGFWQQDYGTEV